MPDVRKRPIAILTNDVPHAIVWALNKFRNVEMYSSHRRVIIANGREFIICSKPEHLLGIEIERYVTAYNPIVNNTKNFELNLERMARTRVRE